MRKDLIVNAARRPSSSLPACLVCVAALVATAAPAHAQKAETLAEGVSSSGSVSSAVVDAPGKVLTTELAPQDPGNGITGIPGIKDLFPQYHLIGKSRLTFWGIAVYDASLWATASFKADDLINQSFALELIYLRDFDRRSIAERSISEMRRSATLSEAQAKAWTLELMRVIPDIKKGDRVVGLNQPDVGAVFMVNGKPSGEIRDVAFARLFFGIWLSPQTSEPKLRSALLAGAT